MLNIIQGTTKKPVSSERLAIFFSTHDEYEGFLYIGYPIIGTSEGSFPIDALLVSEQKGIVIFKLIEGRDLSNFMEEQDDSANKIESKLLAHKVLMSGRRLKIPINVVSFAPALDNAASFSKGEYHVCNENTLKDWLEKIAWDSPDCYQELVAVIQAISTIRKGRKKRVVTKQDSKGAKLKGLEDSIANLDNLQGRAVIESVDDVQRIRGLAGSGKTIVLALKAAYLHAQHPDWKIAVTFNTRSLKGQFKQLINTFTIEQTNEEPDWENIRIIHAWGAPGGGERNGLYYSFCELHNLEYFDFLKAKSEYKKDHEFEGVCSKALSEMRSHVGVYDVILLDEAQDFPVSFLNLCYEMCKDIVFSGSTPKRRMVYAYDELQNLGSHSLPSPEEIFGNYPDGTPRVKFSSHQRGKPHQDIILEKCYRNSRPTLVTAHALGFGIYRKTDQPEKTNLVQIFEHKSLWHEVGYKVTDGDLEDGNLVTLERTCETSPAFLEEHSAIDDLLQFKVFESKEEQDNWVAEEIKRNLSNDELRHDDIVVINPNPLTTRKEVGVIRKQLFDLGINSHLTGVDTSPDIFFCPDRESIAFTGIYRAKGNEAGMVYIVNTQDCYSSFGSIARDRNRLFTAITRSKGWVRVVGIGSPMQRLLEEYEDVKKQHFRLRFKYPTESERKYINIVNRDMTSEEKQKLSKKKDDFATILDDLEAGNIYMEDLGAEQLTRLEKLLTKGKDL